MLGRSSNDLQDNDSPLASSVPLKERQSSLSLARDQTEAILRGIKKRRSEETRKAGTVGASVAAAAAACGVKLKRRLRKNTREKQRRLELNDKFDALNDLLPTSGKSKTEKYHILSEAIKLIGDLQQENEDLRQEKVGLVTELNKLSIYMKDVSTELDAVPTVKKEKVMSPAPAPAAPLPPTTAPPPLEYLEFKVPRPVNTTAYNTPSAPQFSNAGFVAPRPLLPDPSTFNLQASLEALIGFDMPLPFPPLPPTPSSTPPPDLFSSITGSHGPAGMGLTNSVVGPFSNTLFHPSPAAVVHGDDIDSWMS